MSEQQKSSSKELFADIEFSCTKVKEQIYHIRSQIKLLDFDSQVENSLIEHIDKIYREFDSMQTFCKART